MPKIFGAPEHENGSHVERTKQFLAGFFKAMTARRRSLGIQADLDADLALVEESRSKKQDISSMKFRM